MEGSSRQWQLYNELCPSKGDVTAVLLHMHMNSTPPDVAVSKVHEAGPEAALIVYSGQPRGAEEAATGLRMDWIHAYLQKPFAIDHVAGVLDEIRDRR